MPLTWELFFSPRGKDHRGGVSPVRVFWEGLGPAMPYYMMYIHSKSPWVSGSAAFGAIENLLGIHHMSCHIASNRAMGDGTLWQRMSLWMNQLLAPKERSVSSSA